MGRAVRVRGRQTIGTILSRKTQPNLINRPVASKVDRSAWIKLTEPISRKRSREYEMRLPEYEMSPRHKRDQSVRQVALTERETEPGVGPRSGVRLTSVEDVSQRRQSKNDARWDQHISCTHNVMGGEVGEPHRTSPGYIKTEDLVFEN